MSLFKTKEIKEIHIELGYLKGRISNLSSQLDELRLIIGELR